MQLFAIAERKTLIFPIQREINSLSLICIQHSPACTRIVATPQMIWISNSSIIAGNHVWLLFQPIFAVHSESDQFSLITRKSTPCFFPIFKSSNISIKTILRFTSHLISQFPCMEHITHVFLSFFYSNAFRYLHMILRHHTTNRNTLRVSAVNETRMCSRTPRVCLQ